MPAPGLPHLIWPHSAPSRVGGQGDIVQQKTSSGTVSLEIQIPALWSCFCLIVFLRQTFSGLSAALWVHDELWTFLTRGHHRVTNPSIFMTMNRSSFVWVLEKLDTMRMVAIQ